MTSDENHKATGKTIYVNITSDFEAFWFKIAFTAFMYGFIIFVPAL